MIQKLQKPNFAKVYTKANEILMKSSVINTFPYSPNLLVKEQTGTPCRSYSKARKYNLEVKDLGSESAVLVEFRGRLILLYNDAKPENHTRYSILHELGHKENNHDITVKESDQELYSRYEIETNYFAAQLLMPEQLLRELQHRGVNITKQFLQENFSVSEKAAGKRLETLAKTNAEWYSRAEKEFDDVILFKFADFLNKICPATNHYDFEDEYARERERWSWY